MKNKLGFFIAKSNMFGIGFLLLIKSNDKNAYLSVILGMLIGIFIIYLYSIIKKNLNNNKLKDIIKNNFFYRILYILFLSIIMLSILVVLTMFINSFYLVNTPKIIILIPFVILSIYLISKGNNILCNVSNLIFYFSLFTTLSFSFLLIKYVDTSNMYPIFNFNSFNIFKSSLVYASITSIPIILVIDYYDDYKKIYKDYLCASIINLFILLFTALTLGDLLSLYSFPEYATTKQIKYLNFIENIESFSAFGWYSEIFIMLSIIVSNLKNTLPKKFNLLLLTSISFIIVYISSNIIASDYEKVLLLYEYYYIILYVFLIIFISLIFYLKYKKRNN